MRGKEADVRKKEIIEQFYQVLVEVGLEKASLAKIANHLSVSPSLLIHHFKNKDEMLLQLIDYIVGKYTESFTVIFDDIQDSRQRLQTMYNMLIGLIEKEFKDFANQNPNLDIEPKKLVRLVV